MLYLSGFEEPHALLLRSSNHPEHRSVLFMQSRDPARERWDGPRLGVEEAPARLGVDAAFPIQELRQRLPEYLAGATRLHFRFGVDPRFDQLVFDVVNELRARARAGAGAPSEILDSALWVHEMRLRKEPEEIERMRRAAAITCEAHNQAMRFAAPGRFEYEVEAELLRIFRAGGSERPAYECIVGSGKNATVLHYRQNRKRLEAGELLLIDAGCEYAGYAADVTRTFPVSGRFSPEQRDLYEVVLRAQKAAIDATLPGATLESVHQAALRPLTEGLIALGLVEGDLEAALEEQRYKPFYMHRTSHWLGMDVHDVGRYTIEGRARPLEPGFVLTVEPGLYIEPAPQVDERWWNLGIRIEDDVWVQDHGNEVLTSASPKEIGEIEAWMND